MTQSGNESILRQPLLGKTEIWDCLVKVKPQSKKNCEVNSGVSSVEEPEDVIRRFSLENEIV